MVTSPEQIVSSPEVDPTGVGFTVTSAIKVFPEQPFEEIGVTVYLYTPFTELPPLVNIC